MFVLLEREMCDMCEMCRCVWQGAWLLLSRSRADTPALNKLAITPLLKSMVSAPHQGRIIVCCLLFLCVFSLMPFPAVPSAPDLLSPVCVPDVLPCRSVGVVYWIEHSVLDCV